MAVNEMRFYNMVENVVTSLITGKVVATNVSFEEYLEKYAADFCE